VFEAMTQGEVATADSSEAAAVATAAVKPPVRYPNSMLLREIADSTIAAAIEEEETLRSEQSGLRDRKRALKTKLDALLRSRNVIKTKVHQKFDVKINELHTERRRILRALEDLRERQGSRASFRDKLTDLECEMRLSSRAHVEAEARLQAEQEKLKSGKSAEQKKTVEKCKKEVAQKEAEKQRKEEEYAKARVEFNASAPDFAERTARDEEFRDLHAKLNAVLEELEQTNVQRRSATATDKDADEIEATRAEQEEAEAAFTAAENRLVALRALLFPESHHFTYNAAYHQALIGRGGATLRQLQEDFSVAICVDTMPPGHGFVVGGVAEVQSCIAAITSIVKDEEAKNTSTTLQFAEPQLRRELIGPRGSTVERFQDEYDVRMQMDENGVTITGRRRDVAEAKDAIRAYLDTFTQRELTVPVSALPSLLGRGGRNIARIIESSGVRHLRVDRERGVVRATGTPDAVERAFALCRSATGEGEGVTRVVHADDAWVGAVIGPRGATIRQLEEDTNARIQCNGSTISLTGSQEAVANAYAKVAALRRTERTIPADSKRLHFLMSPIVSVTDVDECQSPTVRTPTSRGGSSYITPLEAVRRSTQCDQVVPLRAEGSVVLRGSPEAVNNAYGMLKLLLRHNEPFSINVAFLDILRNFMTNRSKEWGNKNLLDYIPTLFTSPVRIDVDWASRRLTVSSCSEHEARAATSRLIACLREYSATHVRLISNFPEYAISRLLGTRGATVRQLQEATDTEIMLVRDRAQVQVLNAAGDVEKLESAVHAIRVAVFGEEEEDDEEASEDHSHSSGEAFAAQTPTRRKTAV
jgi:rRNA processing protein Krr1/Pno1